MHIYTTFSTRDQLHVIVYQKHFMNTCVLTCHATCKNKRAYPPNPKWTNLFRGVTTDDKLKQNTQISYVTHLNHPTEAQTILNEITLKSCQLLKKENYLYDLNIISIVI